MPTIRFGENTADDYNSTCQDTWMFDLLPANNWDTNAQVVIGTTAATDIIRQLIRFNIKSTLDSLNATAVDSADLYLYCIGENATADETITAYRALLNWVTAEATWNVYSTGNNWNTSGASATSDVTGEDSTADRRATGENGVSITGTGAWFFIDLNTAAEAWRAGTWSEYGTVITNDDEVNADTRKAFDSSEGTDSQRPYLEVVYHALTALRRRIEGY